MVVKLLDHYLFSCVCVSASDQTFVSSADPALNIIIARVRHRIYAPFIKLLHFQMRYSKVNIGKKCSLHLFILNVSGNEHYLIMNCSLYLLNTCSDVL